MFLPFVEMQSQKSRELNQSCDYQDGSKGLNEEIG